MHFNIPREAAEIYKKLQKAKFEAYLVGGCVRDLLLEKKPNDWDIATNAKPEEVQKIFPDSVYENKFGTVGVKTESKDPGLKIVEITTYRLEGKYSDKRHPDEIKFAKTVEEDLSRRDFTINALALSLAEVATGKIIPRGWKARRKISRRCASFDKSGSFCGSTWIFNRRENHRGNQKTSGTHRVHRERKGS
jgi:tRNA nucleotidyltransferase/poly(A) polymerase